jgi:hypothetical protein
MNIKQKFVFNQALLDVFKKSVHLSRCDQLESMWEKDIRLVFGEFCGTVENVFSDNFKTLVVFHELTRAGPLNLSVHIDYQFISGFPKALYYQAQLHLSPTIWEIRFYL